MHTIPATKKFSLSSVENYHVWTSTPARTPKAVRLKRGRAPRFQIRRQVPPGMTVTLNCVHVYEIRLFLTLCLQGPFDTLQLHSTGRISYIPRVRPHHNTLQRPVLSLATQALGHVDTTIVVRHMIVTNRCHSVPCSVLLDIKKDKCSK